MEIAREIFIILGTSMGITAFIMLLVHEYEHKD